MATTTLLTFGEADLPRGEPRERILLGSIFESYKVVLLLNDDRYCFSFTCLDFFIISFTLTGVIKLTD